LNANKNREIELCIEDDAFDRPMNTFTVDKTVIYTDESCWSYYEFTIVKLIEQFEILRILSRAPSHLLLK